MVEPITTVGVAAVAAYLSKDGLNKLLGPTADYLGQGLKGHVEKCNDNLGNVFARAMAKLGEDANRPGVVSPRVLKHLLNDAPFCDDEVAQDYFAGILASSRMQKPSDRAVPYLQLVSSLSSDQLKFHHLYYEAVRTVFSGQSELLSSKVNRRGLATYATISTLDAAFGINTEEDSFALLEHCLYGLRQKSLLEQEYAHGDPDYLNQKYPGNAITDYGVVLWPSLSGIELWFWAQGLRGMPFLRFLDQDLPRAEALPSLPKFLARKIKIE